MRILTFRIVATRRLVVIFRIVGGTMSKKGGKNSGPYGSAGEGGGSGSWSLHVATAVREAWAWVEYRLSRLPPKDRVKALQSLADSCEDAIDLIEESS